MDIKEVKMYRVDGRNFDTYAAARNHIREQQQKQITQRAHALRTQWKHHTKKQMKGDSKSFRTGYIEIAKLLHALGVTTKQI